MSFGVSLSRANILLRKPINITTMTTRELLNELTNRFEAIENSLDMIDNLRETIDCAVCQIDDSVEDLRNVLSDLGDVKDEIEG